MKVRTDVYLARKECPSTDDHLGTLNHVTSFYDMHHESVLPRRYTRYSLSRTPFTVPQTVLLELDEGT